MKRDEIMKLAELCDLGQVCGPLSKLLDHEWESLHRFAAIVAAAEREECAKVCDDHVDGTPEWNSAAINCAADIRARGAA